MTITNTPRAPLLFLPLSLSFFISLFLSLSPSLSRNIYIYIYIYIVLLWLLSYDMDKVIWFKCWTRLFVFYIAPIHLRKVRIQLFSLQLWINCRADWDLKPWDGNQFRRRNTLDSNLLTSVLKLLHVTSYSNAEVGIYVCVEYTHMPAHIYTHKHIYIK